MSLQNRGSNSWQTLESQLAHLTLCLHRGEAASHLPRMWELDCEESSSWTALKNWCFWSVVLEKTLESPLDCKEIQPVHPKWDQPWDFFGRNDAKLKFQYFGHLMRRIESLEKTLILGGIGGRRRRGRQRRRWLDGITDSMDVVWVNSGSWWWTGRPGVLWFMGSQRVGHDWATERINWTELMKHLIKHVLTDNQLQNPNNEFFLNYIFLGPN